jgi:toxin ParE1/3/4
MGQAQADRYTDHLTTAFEMLADFPLRAVACDVIRPGYRRYKVDRHMIYFLDTDYGIAVIRLLHERMDALRHLLR